MTDDQQASTITDRFLAVIRSRKPKHQIDDMDYVAMMYRMIRGLEARACENPELLTHTVALAQRLSEVTNVAIASSAERYALNPHTAASMKECARAMGITPQSASERRARGKAVMLGRIAAAGAVRFAEAKREREAIEAASTHAVTSLADYRARHAAA